MGHKRLARLEEKKGSLLHQPVWLLGLVLMISGEIGNLAAYGDRGTPTAVITAVGCIGVVANLLIATLFLKEPFRVRDLMGGTMVVGGESPKKVKKCDEVTFEVKASGSHYSPETGKQLPLVKKGTLFGGTG